MKLLCMDRQLNISPAYLRPGFAFGGSCLPKDLKALLYLAKSNDVEAADAGERHAEQRVRTSSMRSSRCSRAGKRRVGMIGLSFKAGTDDLRESPLVIMAERFIGKGLQLSHLRSASERGAADRRQSPLHRGKHPAHRLVDDHATLMQLVRDSDVLVVAMKTPEVLAALQAHTRPDQMLLDIAVLPDREASSCALSRRVLVMGHEMGVEGQRSQPPLSQIRGAAACSDHRREPAVPVRSARLAGSAHVASRPATSVSIICPKGKGYEKSFEELDGIAIYRHPQPFEASGALGYLRRVQLGAARGVRVCR